MQRCGPCFGPAKSRSTPPRATATTRFLSELVGSSGRVFAFDVQPEALACTAASLRDAPNVTLLQCDHAEMRAAIPPVDCGYVGVMFNLGYLPGDDHSVTTQTASTLAAIRAALELLRPGGVLTVLAYTGHAGGAEEADAVAQLLRAFSTHEELAEHGGTGAPRLFVVHKPPASG